MENSYEAALARYSDIVELIETGMESVATDEHIRSMVPPGIYEHFKSTPDETMFYVVSGVGRDVDAGIFRVTYRALYPPHAGLIAYRQLVGRNPKTRKHDGFLLPVRRGTYQGPRFVLIEPCTEQEFAEVQKRYMRT